MRAFLSNLRTLGSRSSANNSNNNSNDNTPKPTTMNSNTPDAATREKHEEEDDALANPDTTERIESDLQQVEEELQRTSTTLTNGHANWRDAAAASGRATFESVASALTSLRRRLTRQVEVLTNGGVSASSSSPTSTALMDRLESAELAHAHRIPLGLLHQEMERRQQQQVTDDNHHMKMDDSGGGGAGDSRPPPGRSKEDIGDSSNSDEVSVTGSIRRRRASTLMASRSRDEALQRQAQDREMHNLGNIEVILGLPAVTEDDEEQSAHVKNEEHIYLGEEIIEEEQEKEEEDDQDDSNLTTVLLTDLSRSRLDHSSSAILLMSHSNLSENSGSKFMDQCHGVEAADSAPKPISNTVVFSWGEGCNSLHDNHQTRTPDLAKIEPGERIARNTVLNVSVGPTHAAVVTTTGQVLLCGQNDHGQVDPFRKAAEPVIVRPSLMEFLSNSMTRIVNVSCGRAHTAVVTGGGTVLTWGDNSVGQLGHRKASASIPTAMVGVTRAAEVSCGFEFTTVLTTRMQLFLCGTEDVVTWTKLDEPPLPTTVPTLEGLPLVKAAAGARHVVVLTSAGTAFTWGSNEEGCCSRAFPTSIHTPVPIIFTVDNMDVDGDGAKDDKFLSPFPHWNRPTAEEALELDPQMAISDVACGEAFTLFLTKTGRVYVCGSNGQGQLGLPGQPAVKTATPLALKEIIVAVAAGQCHSLLLDAQSNVWSMGLGRQTPAICLKGNLIRSIYAGGKESVAIAPASVCARLEREFSIQKSSDLVDAELSLTVERLMAQDDKSRLIKRVHDFFGSPNVWNSIFWDPSECDDLYRKLLSSSAEESETTVAIAKAMEQGMLQGLENLREQARLLYPESVRFLLLFLQNPLWSRTKINDNYEFDARGELTLALCETFLNLPFEGYKAIQQWAAGAYGPKYFAKFLIRPLIALLERGLINGAGAKSRAIPGIVTLLRWFHGTAQRDPSLASPEEFHSEAIGMMDPEILYADLKKWKEGGKRSGAFYLSANSFLLSPGTKRTLLRIENQVEMLRAATSNLTWDREQHQFTFDPFFVLAIDRVNLLPQTLQKISAASHVDLRKSLKIVFKGEDAVDAGGVTKEFFHLLSHQLFDSNTGMWSTHFGDHITWFNGDCTWNDDGYYLVGVLTGLAVYNDVLLDVNFPRAVYRKLLGNTLGLEDMVDEETKKGLKQLLDYDGDDVEDIYCLSFEHTWMDLGIQRRVELKPGGADIPVTSDNKEEYVMLYVKWLLVDSVRGQYDAFERGVMRVLESSSLDLLHPEELELLLVGTPDVDIDAWEGHTRYEGYEADSPTIRNFWKFVRNSDRETHLKLLKFTTGTSRAPIGGLGSMPFKIQRAGTDSVQLPTSHTCFNILILPDYGDSYEKMETLLGRAILECEGFGLQ